jgi:hypothetical protein
MSATGWHRHEAAWRILENPQFAGGIGHAELQRSPQHQAIELSVMGVDCAAVAWWEKKALGEETRSVSGACERHHSGRRSG